jgi:carbamoyltransferase
MNILGINPGHNGSAALLIDGELEFYIEEERLTRSKYDGNPFMGILEGLKHGVDVLVLGGTSSQFPQLPWTGEDPYSALIRKHNPKVQVINLGHVHHMGHAASAFYNSGFEDAAAVIVDGSGSHQEVQIDGEGNKNPGFETESIFECDYEDGIKPVFHSLGGNYDTQRIVIDEIEMDSAITIVKAYEAVSEYLGFGFMVKMMNLFLPYFMRDEVTRTYLFLTTLLVLTLITHVMTI